MSHQTIIKILELVAEVTTQLNRELDLSRVNIVLLDEVFTSANSAIVSLQALESDIKSVFVAPTQ